MSIYIEQVLPIELSDEQIHERRERNSDIDLDLARAAEKLDLAKGQYKSETEQIKGEKKRVLMELRQGYVETKVKVMEYFDMERGIVSYTNEEGVEVHSRKMTISEKRGMQTSINHGY